MCTNVKKMHSTCDLPAEFELHDNSFGPNTIYPTLSHNSIYYEENQMYSEVNEHHHEECHKNIKKTGGIPPVKIHEESTVNIDLPPISWHGYETPPKILNVTNTGQTVLINGQWTRCKPYIEGGPMNGTYIFSQIHFHSPSEHEIDGRKYPLEMHVVHYKTSYLTQERAMQEKDGTVVLVYLFQVANTSQTVLSAITNLAHHIERVNDSAELHGIILNQILQPFSSNYYIYWGSVSTSKNSYLLQWIISCSNLYVTQEEVDCLIKIMYSGGLSSETQVPKMNPVNDIVYHVGEEDYNVPLTTAWSKCQCRQVCPKCSSCAPHKGKHQCYLCSHAKESRCALKDCNRKDIKVQICVFEKNSKAVTKLSVCNDLQKKNRKKKNFDCYEASGTSICTLVSSDSQSSVYEVGNRKKKKKKQSCKVQKVSSCPLAVKSLEIICCNDENSSKEKTLSCSLLKKIESNEKEKEVIDMEQKENKSVTENSSLQIKEDKDLTKKTSKVSVKNKPKKKKLSYSKPEKSKKKEKLKKNSPDTKKNVERISKQSVSDSKKGKKVTQSENCDPLVEIQCVPLIECIEKVFALPDMSDKQTEKTRGEEVEEHNESPKICNFETFLPSKEGIFEEKTLITSEPNNEIKTIFEKKRAFRNKEPLVKDCTVNFLLSPSFVPSEPSYTLLMSESKVLKKTKNIEERCPSQNTVQEICTNANSTSKVENLLIDSKEQSEELCLQTEIFFHAEKKSDFTACFSQDYNVAIIYNHNILQEFRGTFSPKELELGSYKKLELVPKYPDTENITVRLKDCFVKMESLDGFFIRAKFLLNKIDINRNGTIVKNVYFQDPMPDLASMNVKDDSSVTPKTKNSQQENSTGNNENGKPGNSNESVLKNKILGNQEFEVEVKKFGIDPKMSDKSFTVDSLQQTFEPVKKEGKKEKDLIEKNQKILKELFYKRKKTVYFICEKIEKDENSGKKIFVGSFRTKKDEIKAVSKDRKVLMNPDPFPIEKSLESKREKKLFLISNKESDFVKLLRIESPMKQEFKLQSSAHYKEMDKLDKSKDLITLHTYEPRNSQANCFEGEGKNLEFQDQEVTKLGVLTPEEINKLEDNLEKSVDSSSLSSEKSSNKNKSQIALIIIPIEGEDLSKIEVILIEHLEKSAEKNNDQNKKENDKKKKEYVPCLNCYN